MKKKKLLALMLSAAMTLTTIVPGVTVFAADADAFTDGSAVEVAFTAGETTAEFNELTLKLNAGKHGSIYESREYATFTVKKGETYKLPAAKADAGYGFYFWDFGGLGMVGGTEVTFDALVNVYKSYNLIKFDGAGNAYVDCTAKYTEVEKPELKELTVIYNLGDHGTYFDQKEVSVTVGNGITHKLPSTADIKADEGWELLFWDFGGLGFQGNTEITFEDLVKYNEEYGFIKYDEKGNASVTCTAQYKEVEKPELKEITVNYDFGEHGTYYGQNVASVTVGNGIAHNLPSNDTENCEIEDGYELLFWDLGNGFGLRGGDEITLELLTYYNDEYDFIQYDEVGNATTTCIAQYKEVAHVHTIEKFPASKEATCTKDGIDYGYHCSDCHARFDDAEGTKEWTGDKVIPALGHVDEDKDEKCDRCGAEVPHVHTIEKFPASKEATCTKDGIDYGYHCPDCHARFDDAEGTKKWTGDKVIPALGHVDEDKDEKCDRCGAEVPHVHTIEKFPASKEATCTKDGIDYGYHCPDCHARFDDAEGTKKWTGDKVIPALGHVDEDKDEKCDRCGAEVPHVHTIEKFPASKEATCTKDGIDYGYHCPDCHARFDDAEGTKKWTGDKVIPALGHVDEDKDEKCDRCGAEVPHVHTIEKFPGSKEATCTKAGIDYGYHCPDCHARFDDAAGTKEWTGDKVIPVRDHVFETETGECKWCHKKAKVNVTFDRNGGDWDDNITYDVAYGTTLEEFIAGSNVPSIGKEGNEFAWWGDAAGKKADYSAKITEDTTFYAWWFDYPATYSVEENLWYNDTQSWVVLTFNEPVTCPFGNGWIAQDAENKVYRKIYTENCEEWVTFTDKGGYETPIKIIVNQIVENN